MKKFFKEFKEFIQRGNVMDMAVGVIIGGAFSAIVTALTDHILRPIINWIIYLCGGGQGIAAYTFLVPIDETGARVADLANFSGTLDMSASIYIDWGAFISAIINFILIAFILFCIVKAMNKVNSDFAAAKAGSQVFTKDEIKAMRKEGKSWKEIKALEEEKLAEQKRLEEEAAAEAAKNAPPTTEQLLTEILEALKNK